MSGLADEGRAALAQMDDATLAFTAGMAALVLITIGTANPYATAALLTECAKRLENRS